MSFHTLIEEEVQRAIAGGEFDNLPGKGKPLDLDDYFRTREDVRAGFALLKNNGFVPAEVAILREIHALEEALRGCSAAEVDEEPARLRRAIQERTVQYQLMIENLRKKRGAGLP